MNSSRGFASDNNAGVHPEILHAINAVNKGHVIGYGSDAWTEKARQLFKSNLGDSAEVFFVFTGTAANVLGISAVTRSWNSIITAFSAHIEQDECGAPEKYSGCKVLTVDTADGKISSEMLSKHMHGFDFEHHSQPRVVSITQSTEMGTVYTPEEISDLAAFVHARGMLLHMDGARIANAAASLGVSFRSITTDAGVDVLSFGGTKNGMMFGEAICFLKPGLSENFRYIRKQGMQLASKMRYISAQYLAYLNDELWRKLALHANSMARMLYDRVLGLNNIRITQQVQSNGLFVIMPQKVAKKLQEHFYFYPWNEETSEFRWMTSWDTTEKDIIDFTDLLKTLLATS